MIALLPHLSTDELFSRYKDATRCDVRTRWHALWLRSCGKKSKVISELLGCSQNAVTSWVKRYNDGGPEAIETNNYIPRSSYLNAEQKAKLAILVMHPPKHCPGWTGKMLLKEIERRFGISYCESAIYPILHQLGFRKLTPRPRHPKADPAWQDAFKEGLQQSRQTACADR